MAPRYASLLDGRQGRSENAALPASQSADDALLLSRLRADDGAAFEQLVRENGPRMLALARRLLRNEEDARDAVQEAFASAVRGLPGFAGHSKLSTWLSRITANCALMRLRSRKRRHEISVEDLLPRWQPDGHPAELPLAWSDPGPQAAERVERQQLVRAAIDRLPETSRNVLLLRDIEGLDTADVAELLGVTPNAVKIRLHRARQALRQVLDPHFREVTR